MLLTKSLRWDIQNLGQRLAAAANEEHLSRKGSSTARSKVQNEVEVKRIIIHIRKLLGQIEDAVPLINLAITTSGASLSTALPTTISPSRLLQASTFLTAGDTQYSTSGSSSVQIGPTFTLTLYMLFAGHVRPQTAQEVRQSTWKEVIHKARMKLLRVPLDAVYALNNPSSDVGFDRGSDLRDSVGSNISGEVRSDEFAYQMIIIEDLEDDRVHTYEDGEPQPGPFAGISLAGIREVAPIHEISKIFYADTGKILNIGSDGETNNPVLLLKRDLNAIPPRRMMERTSEGSQVDESDINSNLADNDPENDDGQSEIDAQLHRESRAASIAPEEPNDPKPEPWRIPHDLDPEWLAFEVYNESEESDSESDTETSFSEPQYTTKSSSPDSKLVTSMSTLKLDSLDKPSSPPANSQLVASQRSVTQPKSPTIRTSLSLLETILRLLSLQQFQQSSHLSISDELLNFFLSESATTGAASGDENTRRRLRNDARNRVGFDPYDESPIKRRGEEYQYRGGASQAGGGNMYQNGSPYDEVDWNVENRTYYGSQSSPRYQDGSGQSYYDEGYETHRFVWSRQATPDSPLRLKQRPDSSRGLTPDRSTPSLVGENGGQRSSLKSPRTPQFASERSRFNDRAYDSLGNLGRKGSPLVRESTEVEQVTVEVTEEPDERQASPP